MRSHRRLTTLGANMADDLEEELERYAELTVMLSEPGADRTAILSACDLDEAGWEAHDAQWQQRLSADASAADASGQIPPMWLAFSQALQRVQERRSKTVLPIERYAELARVLTSGGDVAHALQSRGVTMVDFLRAHRHWLARATKDGAIAKALEELLK